MVLIESDGALEFGGYDTDNKDAIILEMDTSGTVLRGVQVSLYNSDMTI